jgi:hypothetical protein
MRIRIRLVRRIRGYSHESSVAVQKLDWSHPVKVSPGGFLNLRFTNDDLGGAVIRKEWAARQHRPTILGMEGVSQNFSSIICSGKCSSGQKETVGMG